MTGFLIIFILLTFSAYSSSVNVGGRSNTTAVPESQQEDTKIKVTANSSQVNSPSSVNTTSTKKSDKTVTQTQKTELNKRNSAESSAADAANNQSETEKQQNTGSASTFIDNEKRPEKEEGVFQQQSKAVLMDRIKVHTVRSGETLWDIAHKHGLNIDSLIGANNISNMNSIKPGQEFKILPVKGILYRVSPGESVYSIADKFDINPQQILRDNNIAEASHLKIDQTLILRGAKPEFSYRDRLDKKFMYPIKTRITSYYGPRWGRIHEGIDFAAPTGSPIRAVSSGRVVYSGWASGYGKVVIIEHQKGLRTLYAHNSSLLVRNGERVGRGEVISRSGNTGNSTGPHLHFEVQVNGRPENPLNYLNK